VDTPDGHWWAVYLATRHANYGHFSIGRETFLAPVEWRDGWPIVKPQDMSQLTVYEPTLPLHPWPAAPARDDFSSNNLALAWNFLDFPQPGLFSLTARPGFLRLRGQSAGLEYSPGAAFVARRQTEWNGTEATRMEFEPVAENEEAGLAVFMSPDFHYEIYKTRRGGKLTVALRKCVGDIKVVTAMAEAGKGALQLKVEYDPEHYRFYYAQENGEWKLLGSGLERLISSEVADVWSGTMIGTYSTGNGYTVANPADFDWFEDRPVHVPYKSEF
jgi:alpha-N-arabinofuranosidase